MDTEAPWRSYERRVFDELQSMYGGRATLEFDARLPGERSGIRRQIDVLIRQGTPDRPLLTAVDAKHHQEAVDVKEVETFIGLLQDIGVNRGVMIASSGYSTAALTRAHRDDVDVDLDILTLEEYRQSQGPGGIPYAGRNGVVISAPVGWALDCQQFPNVLARLYQRGLTFEAAAARQEFAYVNIWDRTPPIDRLEHLLDHQEHGIRSFAPDAMIMLRELPSVLGARSCIRRMETAHYPTAEITGFVEFPDSILFVVLFTPLVVERRNTRKLEQILASALPLHVGHDFGAA